MKVLIVSFLKNKNQFKTLCFGDLFPNPNTFYGILQKKLIHQIVWLFCFLEKKSFRFMF